MSAELNRSLAAFVPSAEATTAELPEEAPAEAQKAQDEQATEASHEAEQKVEQPETGEARLAKLNERAQKIASERREAFGIGNLTYEGGQELISIFGAEKFTAALDQLAKAEGTHSMFDLIKQLEPDRSKRSELYRKMDELADAALAEFNHKDQELARAGDSKAYDDFRATYAAHDFGPTANNIRSRHQYIDSYRILDNLAGIQGMTTQVVGRIQSALLGRTSSMAESARQGSRALDALVGADLSRLQAELAQNSGSLATTVAERYRSVDQQTQELREAQDALVQELRTAIDAATREIEGRTTVEKQQLVHQLAQGSAEFNPGHPNQAEQLDAFVASMEARFQALEAQTQLELTARTANEQALLKSAEGVGVGL